MSRIKFLGSADQSGIVHDVDGNTLQLLYGQDVSGLIGDRRVTGKSVMVGNEWFIQIPLIEMNALFAEVDSERVRVNKSPELFAGQRATREQSRREAQGQPTGNRLVGDTEKLF